MYPREMKIYVTKDLSMNTFCSIIPKSQKLETTDMSINGRMYKQAVVYTYNGILFNNKKEWIINTLLPHAWTSKSITLGERSQSQKNT